MKKFLVAMLATCAVIAFFYLLLGHRMLKTAFDIPSIHLSVSWMMVTFLGVAFGCWRIVKGK